MAWAGLQHSRALREQPGRIQQLPWWKVQHTGPAAAWHVDNTSTWRRHLRAPGPNAQSMESADCCRVLVGQQ
jgi:hypothetical protein